nr:MAG TPA: hypothetical protein [Bacteriophage sp.]
MYCLYNIGFLFSLKYVLLGIFSMLIFFCNSS